MKLGRSALRDLGLLLLALAAVAAALYAVTRTPDVEADRLTARPGAATPTVSATPARTDADVLLLAPTQGLASAVTAAGGDLGWRVTADVRPGGFVAGQTFVDRVPALLQRGTPDLVLLASPTDPAEEAEPQRLAGNVAFVVDAVRDAHPDAQVVLLAPVAADEQAYDVTRGVLQSVAARFGAVLVDPVGRRWISDLPGATAPNGDLTSAGQAEVARRLAADLRTVLPTRLAAAP